MLKGAIARRYAGAMFDLGLKQKKLDQTLDDVREIAGLCANRKLAYLLREPKVPLQRKEMALRQALGSRVLPTSLNLALLVVQRELVELMPNIARELEQLVLNYKNQAIAEVTTAMKIDDAQTNLIKQALEHRTGKSIILQTRVRPEILGGVIARVGDQLIDGSILYRLSALRQQLLNSRVNNAGNFLSEAETHAIVARTEQATAAQATPGDGAAQQNMVEPSRLQ